MKTLPNGLKIFNATPHPITFWSEDWPDIVEVPCDTVVNAEPQENVAKSDNGVTFVRTLFVGTDEGREIVAQAMAQGAVVVGSIIAAQAYPGFVVAMVPCKGYERVPPVEKRMRPDKFTLF